MVLRFQMVCSGAVILVWVDLPDNDPPVCNDTADVEFHVVFNSQNRRPRLPIPRLLLLQQNYNNL